MTIHTYILVLLFSCSKQNLNASRPSEHPLVRGENVKTFRWNHRLLRSFSLNVDKFVSIE